MQPPPHHADHPCMWQEPAPARALLGCASAGTRRGSVPAHRQSGSGRSARVLPANIRGLPAGRRTLHGLTRRDRKRLGHADDESAGTRYRAAPPNARPGGPGFAPGFQVLRRSAHIRQYGQKSHESPGGNREYLEPHANLRASAPPRPCLRGAPPGFRRSSHPARARKAASERTPPRAKVPTHARDAADRRHTQPTREWAR